VMRMKERIFSPLPRDDSLEELVPEVNFYRRLKERFHLSFVRRLVEDHANPSLLNLTRLPTDKVAESLSFCPKIGVYPDGGCHSQR
jgi:hypothetical protein